MIVWHRFTPQPTPKRWTPWMGLIAVRDDGAVFVPAAVTGKSDAEVFLCAGWDGDVTVVENDNHLYVPAQWVKRELN